MEKLRKALSALVFFGGITALCIWLGIRITPQQIQAVLSEYGMWAAPAYVAAFTLLPVFFFPVAVLALAGGLLFGLWWGSIYTFLGAMLNCALMFLLARYAGRSRVEALLRKKLDHHWQQRLRGLEGSGGFVLLVILRLSPAVPYNLINDALGLTAMPLRTYLAASAIGIIPGTLVFINLGDKALDVASGEFWIAVGLLVLLLLATALLGRKFFQKKQEGEGK